MALHAYKCPKCHTVFEELIMAHRDDFMTAECPECETVSKKMWHPKHPPLPIFKVTGFYITDYKRKNSIA
jgi:predicted nucleic acid-binding Zn ribbon protein